MSRPEDELSTGVTELPEHPKETPPPFPVRVFRGKAPGGDLLVRRSAIVAATADQEKTPTVSGGGFWDKAPGGDLLLHGKATLPSAHARFTSEFGMGSGGTTPLWPPGKGWEQRFLSASSTFF